MNHIHIADHEVKDKKLDEYHRPLNIHQFLRDNFPNDPRPIGPMRQGWVRVVPGDPTFKPTTYQPTDQSGCVQAWAWGDHIFVGQWDHWNREPGPKDRRGRDTAAVQATVVPNSDIPLTAEVFGEATTREIQIREWDGKQHTVATKVDTYGGGGRYDDHPDAIPLAYVNVRFKFAGDDVADRTEPMLGVFKFMQPDYGIATLDPNGTGKVTVTSNFYGMARTWTENLQFVIETYKVKQEHYSSGSISRYYGHQTYYKENDPFPVLIRHLKASTTPDGKAAWIKRFVDLNPTVCTLAADPDKSLASVCKRKDIKPVFDRLVAEDPTGWWMFQFLRDGRNKDKRCNNSMLGTMLTTVGTDFDKLKSALSAAWDILIDSPVGEMRYSNVSLGWETSTDKEDFWWDLRRTVCLSLEGAKERHQDMEARSDFTKQRNLGVAADTLEITEAFPLLRAAIVGGKIPVGIFVQPDKSPVNREYPIWEKALARADWSEVIFEIAEDAARRSNYERDVVPYLAFLFRIERYLDKHAPTGNKKKGWAAMPRYVQSSSELEFQEEDATGTVKRRSAFTPVADNDKHTVTVPFVAVKVYGAVTQWCYAQHYHVFEEGMTDPISGGIVVKDLEVKLNGRDDYGLCFYTLIGTDTATGYPTFLVIFERLNAGKSAKAHKDCQNCQYEHKPYHSIPHNEFTGKHKDCPRCNGTKTRVHFHRVRPCRSKDGIRTAACKLVEACYQFMAGNVPATEIVAQQGDLMFMRCDNDPIKAGSKVAEPQEGRTLEFESHKFLPMGDGGIMSLYVSEAKQPANRLGFIYAPNGLRVEHPEHENIEHLAEGWWEIRRAKSYENNPVTIWSRTID